MVQFDATVERVPQLENTNLLNNEYAVMLAM
jgi:hypothetical protein